MILNQNAHNLRSHISTAYVLGHAQDKLSWYYAIDGSEAHQIQRVGAVSGALRAIFHTIPRADDAMCRICGGVGVSLAALLSHNETSAEMTKWDVGHCQKCRFVTIGHICMSESHELYIALGNLGASHTRVSVINSDPDTPTRIFAVSRDVVIGRTIGTIGGSAVKSSPDGGVYNSLLSTPSYNIGPCAQTAFISENMCVVLNCYKDELTFDIRYPSTPIYAIGCRCGVQIV
jgi:hypothetical protein